MWSKCVMLAVLGCAVAVPVAQYQAQQAEGGIPPHLLRQYIGQQAQHQPAPRPAPARLPYAVQSEPEYQPQYQTQAQPQPQPQYRPQYQAQRPQEQREPEEYDANPSYQFGFDVNDDQFTNYQNRKEQRDGDVIKGSYSVVDSDGFIRTVTYTADPKEGFKAEVSRQPTDIVVKVPTPKPQTLQTVAHAAPQRPQQYSQPAQQYSQPAQQYSQASQQYSQAPQQYSQAAQQPQQYYRYEQ